MTKKRLTNEDIDAIVAAYLNGEKTALIAHRFGCSRSYPTILAKRRGVVGRKAAGWRRRRIKRGTKK